MLYTKILESKCFLKWSLLFVLQPKSPFLYDNIEPVVQRLHQPPSFSPYSSSYKGHARS